MTKKTLKLSALLCLVFGSALQVLAAGVTAQIGSLQINLDDAGSGGCAQIPITITDDGTLGGGDGFELNQITISLEITGNAGIINGGIAQQFFVPNGFTNEDVTGLTSPGTDLTVNSSILGGTDAPVCTNIFNALTEGQAGNLLMVADGDTGDGNANFPAKAGGAPQRVMDPALGGDTARKQFTITTLNPATDPIGTTDGSSTYLVAVLEIPFSAVASPSYLEFRLLTNAEAADGNIINYDNATRADIKEFLTLGAPGVLSFVNDCNTATVSDNNGTASGTSIAVNWIDPQDGGNGFDYDMTVTHDTDVDWIHVVGDDGSDAQYAADASGTTVINFMENNHANGDVNYDISLIYDFGGNMIDVDYVHPTNGSTICQVSTATAAPTANIVADPSAPLPGDPVDFDVTLTNAFYDGTKYGTLTAADGSVIDLTAPSGTAGNVFTFDNAYSIAAIDPATEAGTYTVNSNGPNGTSASDSTNIGFDCPDAADFPSSNVTAPANSGVFVGDAVTVMVDQSAVSVLDYEFYYAGHNGGAPVTGQTADLMFTATAGEDSFFVRAHGFGDTGGGVFADCYYPNAAGAGIVSNPDGIGGFWYEFPIDWAPAICADGVNGALQLQAGFVPPFDINALIGVELVHTGGIANEMNIASASVSGVAMTQTNPGRWEATVNATPGMEVTVTGVDGATSVCTQTLLDISDFNCILVTTNIVPILGNNITIEATIDCTYNLFESPIGGLADVAGMTPVASALITDDGNGDAFGTGTFAYPVQPDMFYYVALDGDATGTILLASAAASVPTLGEWGMIAFLTLLAGAALVMMRRRKLA